MAQHESQQQSTAVVTPPAASGLDTDRHTVSETSLDSVTGPAPAAGPRKNPHVRIQVEGRHDHMTSISDNASLSPQQRHCVLVNPHNQGMDGQSSTGSQTQTPAGPQLTPAHFHSSDSSLSLPGQGSAQSSIGNPGNFSGDDEAESSRVGDLNTPEQRQQSALAFRNVISELRQQQGNRQHSNDDVASATSSHYGKAAALITDVLRTLKLYAILFNMMTVETARM